MEIKVGFDISYTSIQPTPMVIMLSIHPSRQKDIIGTETIVAEPNVPIGFYRDSFGNMPGGPERRRDFARQRAGARFRISRCGGPRRAAGSDRHIARRFASPSGV